MLNYEAVKAIILDHLNSGEFDKAAKYCQSVEDSQKGNSDFYYIWGVATGSSGNHELANSLFFKSVKLDMSNTSALMNYVISCFPLGQAKNAINMIDKSLESLDENSTELVLQNILEALAVGDILYKDLPLSICGKLAARTAIRVKQNYIVDNIYSVRDKLNNFDHNKDDDWQKAYCLILRDVLTPIDTFIRETYSIELNSEHYPNEITLCDVTTQILNVNIYFDTVYITYTKDSDNHELVNHEEWFDLIGSLCLLYLYLEDFQAVKEVV